MVMDPETLAFQIVVLPLAILALVALCYFCASVVLDAEETANDLHRKGQAVRGFTSTPDIAANLAYLRTRLTAFAAAYLVGLAILLDLIILRGKTLLLFEGATALVVIVVIVNLLTELRQRFTGPT